MVFPSLSYKMGDISHPRLLLPGYCFDSLPALSCKSTAGKVPGDAGALVCPSHSWVYTKLG